jgi:hypothetical protein
MGTTIATGLAVRVLRPAAPGRFDPAELDGLPEPVRRHLAMAVAPGTPLATSARLAMRDSIKVGRWLPFRAHQVLDPHHGFVWAARAAGLITGTDRSWTAPGSWTGSWPAWSPSPTARVPTCPAAPPGGPGPRRSGCRRRCCPGPGCAGSAPARDQVTAAFAVGETPVELQLRLDEVGRVVALAFDRWGDPGGGSGFGWHRFGGEVTGYASFGGLTIPSAGRLG